MANTTVATYSGRGIIWNRLLGNGTVPQNIGWGVASAALPLTGSASANVNLFTPTTETRTAGTASIVTTTQLGDTLKVIGTIVCQTAPKTITEAGLFDVQATLSSTSTLAATLTSLATTMTLGAIITPTSGGNFYAQLLNETILVTGAANTTLTIARNQLGTTASTTVAAIGTSVTTGGDGGAGGWTTGQTASVVAANGGNMFIHADFAGIALSVNDSIAFTFTDTLT